MKYLSKISRLPVSPVADVDPIKSTVSVTSAAAPQFKKRRLPRFMPKYQVPLLIMVILASVVNAFTMGYDTMMMSSLIAIPQFTDYFTLTPTKNGLINASIWIGSIVACFFEQWLADTLGRKRTIMLASSLSFIGVALQTATTSSIAMFVIARIVLGACTQLTGAASPLILSEISPTKRRGLIVGLYFTFFSAGSIVATGITYATVNISGTWAWRLPSLLQAIPSVVSIVFLFFIPESPRWMIMQGDIDYAKRVFKVSHKMNDEEAEALAMEIHATIEQEKLDPKGPWRTLFINPSPADLRRHIIVFSLGFICELAGSGIGTFYFTIILQQAGVTDTKTLLEVNLINACWAFVVSVAGAYFFDYFGRKKQAIVSYIGSMICLILLGVFVKVYGNNSTNTSGQYATIFFMFLYNTFFDFSFVPLNSLYPTEIYPMKTRAAGVTLFQFWNDAFGLVATFILPICMDAVGWKFYIINAGYDVAFLFVIMIFWVETKGLSLEQMEQAFETIKIPFMGERKMGGKSAPYIDGEKMQGSSVSDTESSVKVIEVEAQKKADL